jgi:glucose/arabinose dehydrogenase
MRRFFSVVAVGLSSLAIGVSGNPSPAAALPTPGFTDTVVPNPAGNPLDQPTTIIGMNAGRAMILEKTGKVRLMRSDGSISPSDVLSLAVCSSSEMGLLGAALDPAFGINGYVYLYYSHSTGNCATATGRANRVSRFTMVAETIDPASEKVLLDNIAATGGNHDGGDLEVGQDGYLYVSIGDAGTNPRGASALSAATDLSLLNGKILRITTNGGVPADNPLVGDPNAISCAFGGLTTPVNRVCTEIFAWGLRNPYRFAFDPNAGSTRFFINDVGQNTTEEVDDGGIGRNYGWNSREGLCPTGQTIPCPAAPAGLTDPLTTYTHDTGCTYITAGAFVPNGVWPAQYDSTYLFADGGCGKIWQRNGSAAVDYLSPFATTTGGIVDMAFILQSADPALYYVTNGDGLLHKITYDAPPASPSLALAFTPLPSPVRAYDTRYNVGTAVGMMRGGTTRLVSLPIADPAIKAALVNITMVGPLGGGYLTASQPRTEHPATSNVNAIPGEVVANASIVPVDSSGHLLLYTFVTTDVVVDVMGTFSSTTGPTSGKYIPVPPKRLIDTREPFDNLTNNFTASSAGGVVTVNALVSGRAGVVPGVSAVAFIVTGLSAASPNAGYVAVYPGHTAAPPSSNLNVNGSNDIRANLVIVPLGADGSIDLTLFATASVVVDVAGYITTTSGSAGLYHLIAPSRQVDTRTGLGFATLAVNGTGTLNLGAVLTPPFSAVSQNVTLTQTAGAGFVTAYPSGGQLPLASNGNSTAANQDRAAFSLTKVGPNGAISYYTSSGTDLVVDITGYFD